MAKANPVLARDVAEYILRKLGAMSAMKLQKLVYYSQAWGLVWTDRALFSEEIEAWADGPVVRSLYNKHKGRFRVAKGFFGGNPDALSDDQRDAIDKTLGFYGSKDAQWLSELTHIEKPWIDARQGLAPGARGEKVITKDSMMRYYSSL